MTATVSSFIYRNFYLSVFLSLECSLVLYFVGHSRNFGTSKMDLAEALLPRPPKPQRICNVKLAKHCYTLQARCRLLTWFGIWTC